MRALNLSHLSAVSSARPPSTVHENVSVIMRKGEKCQVLQTVVILVEGVAKEWGALCSLVGQ